MQSPLSPLDDWLLSTRSTGDPSAEVVLGRVDAGIQLRRQLDRGATPTWANRREELMARLTELQFDATKRIARELGESHDRAPSPLEQSVAELLEDWLRRDEDYFADVVALDDALDAEQVLCHDAFGEDLTWYGILESYLSHEPEPDRAYAIRARIDQLDRSLDLGDWTESLDADPLTLEAKEQCRQDCFELKWQYLDRRLQDELDSGTESASPMSLWNRRFQLSRLIAERRASMPNAGPADSALLAKIDDFQRQLADRAEERLRSLEKSAAHEACLQLTLSAQEESNDILTMVEDVPLPIAIAQLRVNASDFRRLRETLRQAESAQPRKRSWFDRSWSATLRRLARRSRNELQEKKLTLRMESIFGRRFVAVLENTVLILILAMTVLIVSEWFVSTDGVVPSGFAEFFAWTDLAICSVFLFEFFLKLALVEDRLRYFRRHLIVDFLASIPFGFFAHFAGQAEVLAADDIGLLRLLRFARLPQLARYLRIAQPIIRIGRLFFYLLRTTDRLMRRNAHVFNRNIVLFEADALGLDEPSYRLRLARLREQYVLGAIGLGDRLPLAERVYRVERALGDLRARLNSLPTTAVIEPVRRATAGRNIYAEEVVRELVDMTAERLVQRMGPRFPESVSRYVRLLNVPLVRRLPWVRELLATMDRGSGEVAALASNMVGYSLQGILDVGYFVADLCGTISGPIFLDRLGSVLVAATARNAKRLVQFTIAVLVLSGLVWLTGIVWLSWVTQKVTGILLSPLLILGAICLVIMLLGQWLKRIANQRSEEGERLVEAQFASQTKQLKHQYASEDLTFIAERIVDPEFRLRRSDDPLPGEVDDDAIRVLHRLRQAIVLPGADPSGRDEYSGGAIIENDEHAFVRSVALLHLEYQDSGLFRPTDTKTTTQLLGNLALENLRHTKQVNSAREKRRLRSLDLARGQLSLFGGPYLWFNYVTKLITEETAKLIQDYNENAIPLDRLQSASRKTRDAYRAWLARRLRIPVESLRLPEPVGAFGNSECQSQIDRKNQYETFDFTTIDFLTDDRERDEEIALKFGDDVCRLLRLDRRHTIRKAFRSFPLHRFPESQRTVNPFSIYLDSVAGGRVFLIPFRMIIGVVRGIIWFFRQVYRTIHDILNPTVVDEEALEDSYAVALRKIHRMRKPSFMATLWMRARFDPEYLGLMLPGIPRTVGSASLLDDDLAFIGSSRRERLAAEVLVVEVRRRLDRLRPACERVGLNLETLPSFLADHYPYLEHRSAEVIRALAVAWVANQSYFFSLGISLDGVAQFLDWARDPDHARQPFPSHLTMLNPAVPPGPFPGKNAQRIDRLLDLIAPQDVPSEVRERWRLACRKHWASIRTWARIITVSAGESDPKDVFAARAREIILRTDLWSDQIVTLRTLQTLSMLDVYHYCRVVWTLGSYGAESAFPVALPAQETAGETVAALGP